MSPAVGSRSNCIGIAWWQVGRTALRLEEKQGLRNMFGGSAKFAVQCIAVESWLPMAVAKEVQYIVQGLRCVFLPPASPAFGGVAWTTALLANQEQDRPFYIKQTSGSFPCTVGQRRRNPEGTAPSLKRSVFKYEVRQGCATVDGNKIGMKGEKNSGRQWTSSYIDLVFWNYSALAYLIGWSQETNQTVKQSWSLLFPALAVTSWESPLGSVVEAEQRHKGVSLKRDIVRSS